MEKHDIFQFTAPNGVKVIGAVIEEIKRNYNENTDQLFTQFLCYAQNRLFTYNIVYSTVTVAVGQNEFGDDVFEEQQVADDSFGEVLVDYCILPDYDEVLKNYHPDQDV